MRLRQGAPGGRIVPAVEPQLRARLRSDGSGPASRRCMRAGQRADGAPLDGALTDTKMRQVAPSRSAAATAVPALTI